MQLHVYVLSNLNQEKIYFYFKRKTYTSKKKIRMKYLRVCTAIFKLRKIIIETSALFEFVVNMQEKKKNKEILLATHQDLLKISRLCQDRQNT